MRGMMEMVVVMVVLIIGVAVILPVFNEISKTPEMKNITRASPFIPTIINLIPLFIGIAMILVVVGMFLPSTDTWGSSSSDDEDTGDEEVEEADPVKPEELPKGESDKTKERLWAEEILKRRYARGELTDEEYTEKMSRL